MRAALPARAPARVRISARLTLYHYGRSWQAPSAVPIRRRSVVRVYLRTSLGAVNNVWETRHRLVLEYLEKLADQLRSKEQIAPAELEEQVVRLRPAPNGCIRVGRVLGLPVPRRQLEYFEYLGVAGQRLGGQRGHLLRHRNVGNDAIHLPAQPLPDQRLHALERRRIRVVAGAHDLLGLGQHPVVRPGSRISMYAVCRHLFSKSCTPARSLDCFARSSTISHSLSNSAASDGVRHARMACGSGGGTGSWSGGGAAAGEAMSTR